MTRALTHFVGFEDDRYHAAVAETTRAEAILDERDRCAFVAEQLARRWRASAKKTRERGTQRYMWFGPTYVLPSYERAAKDIEAAAAGLDAISYIIRRGLDLPERKQEKTHVEGSRTTTEQK